MMLRKLVVFVLTLTLVSCRPVFDLSFYNGSGVDLRVNGHNGETVVWPDETYLTFNSAQSNMIGPDYPDIEFSVSAVDGRNLIYAIDKVNSEEFRFVSSGAWNEDQRPAKVSASPNRACLHMRIEPDMKMYWLENGCGQKSLNDTPKGVQPSGFPVVPSSE